jgi:para-aminobenzoate synthetase component 1
LKEADKLQRESLICRTEQLEVKFVQQINAWSDQKIPYLFVIDFELKKPFAFPLSDINPNELLYEVNGKSNAHLQLKLEKPLMFEKYPVHPELYYRKYQVVADALHRGESYLTNLTIETPVTSNFSLHELFFATKAKYKLWFSNQFLVFSPEPFIRIMNGKIFSYPMKGTIDASMPQAKQTILQNEKEKAEHVTIVDLIRNDLSMVAYNVTVNRFRYVDELKTLQSTLLQVSSEIQGELKPNLGIGDVLMQLLPAGSISGAPKKKTTQLIREAEQKERGYFTGVFGIFDGENMDSGVMIRYIESTPQGLIYRSGGGITAMSKVEQEYEEATNKVYVPVY